MLLPESAPFPIAVFEAIFPPPLPTLTPLNDTSLTVSRINCGVVVPSQRRLLLLSQKKFALFSDITPPDPAKSTDP
jgi:hypothetical protein